MTGDWGVREDGIVSVTFSDRTNAERIAAKPGRTLVRFVFGEWQEVD